MTELDLRLHLHKPRPSRITEDIFNVRVGEQYCDWKNVMIIPIK